MRIQLVLALFVSFQFALAQTSHLHTLDMMLAETGSQGTQGTAENATSFLLDHLRGPLLDAVDRAEIEQYTAKSESDYLSGASQGIPEIKLVEACNQWKGTVELGIKTEPNAAALHDYRVAMSEVSPHLFRRGSSGQVSYLVSPIEALYIVDVCLSEGGVPHVQHGEGSVDQASVLAAASSYGKALTKYESTTSAIQRKQLVLRLLKSACLM
ncbi:MAG: hypothetical protein HKL84_08110 [Acidimicrobiaceae bacterium]|nr:hypothetical protein [Acidimicrobiaceae bacterium]